MFSHKKQRSTFSTAVKFRGQKQQNRVLCHPLGDSEVTYTINLWLVGKRMGLPISAN